MFELPNFSGFDLYQPFPGIDQWVFDTKYEHKYHGTLKEIVKFMTNKMGFYVEDIEIGLNFVADNADKAHNAIHFGSLKSPLFSFKKEIPNEEKAS